MNYKDIKIFEMNMEISPEISFYSNDFCDLYQFQIKKKLSLVY